MPYLYSPAEIAALITARFSPEVFVLVGCTGFDPRSSLARTIGAEGYRDKPTGAYTT